jgi:hypothetical protein
MLTETKTLRQGKEIKNEKKRKLLHWSIPVFAMGDGKCPQLTGPYRRFLGGK